MNGIIRGLFFTILLGIFATGLSAQVPWEKLPLADSLYQAKAYEPALDNYQALLKYYNEKKTLVKAARCAAQVGDQKLALGYLQKAFQLGFSSRSLLTDPELAPLRQEPKFTNLAQKMEAFENRRAEFARPDLLAELDAMYTDNQKYRNRKDMQAEQALLDSINIVRLERLIKQYGWLGSNMLNGRNYCWLIIQHQPLAVQKKYAGLMAKAVKKGEEDPAFLAYLEDRMAVAQGKKQKYGSQIDQENRRFYPIKDPEKVDVYRASVGLGSIETLRKLNRIQ